MTTDELKLECLKLALDYAKYVEKHRDRTYYSVNGIIDNASEFFTFASTNEEEKK